MAQIGTGTTILTAANTYRGGTTIAAGTLQLGDGGDRPAASSATSSTMATLAFNRSRRCDLRRDDLGERRRGADRDRHDDPDRGQYLCGGTTIAAGTLQLGDGGADGSILGDVLDNGTLAFNRSDVATFAGTISGSGARGADRRRHDDPDRGQYL